jgi:hypothetical protein
LEEWVREDWINGERRQRRIKGLESVGLGFKKKVLLSRSVF